MRIQKERKKGDFDDDGISGQKEKEKEKEKRKKEREKKRFGGGVWGESGKGEIWGRKLSSKPYDS